MVGSSRQVVMLQLAFLPAVNGLTTMAPNLALSKHVLIQNMISSKLYDKALKDDDIAEIVECSDCTVRRIRLNLLRFRSTEAHQMVPGDPRPSLILY
jgi:hypothetical protein